MLILYKHQCRHCMRNTHMLRHSLLHNQQWVEYLPWLDNSQEHTSITVLYHQQGVMMIGMLQEVVIEVLTGIKTEINIDLNGRKIVLRIAGKIR